MSLETNSLQLKQLLSEINSLTNNPGPAATNLLNYINEEIAVSSTNKFDKSSYTASVVLDSSGNVTSNSSYCSTNYIHVRYGQKILVSRGTGSGYPIVRSVEYFDINKNRLSWSSETTAVNNGFTTLHNSGDRLDSYHENTVANSYYVRIYFPVANLNDYMVQIFDNHVNFSTGSTEITTYSSFKSTQGVKHSEFWYGKKIAVDGDSIIEGYSNSDRSYATYCCEAMGCTIANSANGGSTLAVKDSSPTDRDPLVDRYTNMENADAAIIAIGTNDWNYSWTPFGDMSSSDKYTFYGALKILCLGLLEKYSGKPLVFCTPIKRAQTNGLAYYEQNTIGKTLGDYANAIKEVCGYYGIPVLDLYSECLINPIITSHNTAYFYNGDGTHPNAVGHTIIAKRLKGYLLQLVGAVRE